MKKFLFIFKKIEVFFLVFFLISSINKSIRAKGRLNDFKSLLNNSNNVKETLLTFRPFFENLDKKDDYFLYYKAVFYSKLAKYELSIDNDAQENIKKSLTIFKKLLDNPNTKLEIKKLSEFNLNELFQRYINRGLKYYKLNALERSLNNFAIAESILPKNTLTYLYKSFIYYKKGISQTSFKLLQDYFNLKGEDKLAYYLLSKILLEKKDYDESIITLNQGLLKYTFCDYLIATKLKLLKDINRLNEKEFYIKNLSKEAKLYQKFKFYLFKDEKKKAFKYLKFAYKAKKNVFEINRSLGIYYYNRIAEIYEKKFDKFLQKISKKNSSIKTDTKNLKKHDDELLRKKYLKKAKFFLKKAKRFKEDKLTNTTLNKIYEIQKKDESNEKKKSNLKNIITNHSHN